MSIFVFNDRPRPPLLYYCIFECVCEEQQYQDQEKKKPSSRKVYGDVTTLVGKVQGQSQAAGLARERELD